MQAFNTRRCIAAAGLAAMLAMQGAWGKLPPEEMAKLGVEGTPLTPMGAIRAGNADGTIPAWTGGIESPPANFVKGGAWVDPYADDKPLFTITAQNYEQHVERLTPGQVAMFKQYPDSFRMHVYPTRRSASYPDWVYQQTLKQAQNAELCPQWETEGKVCLVNHIDGGGIPFPIPKNGAEAYWNHYLAYRGQSSKTVAAAPLIDNLGNRIDVIMEQWQSWIWWVPAAQRPSNEWFHRDGGPLLCDAFRVMQPPRSSGLIGGGCNYAQNFDFQAYLYVPGQRRVRKAPEIGFHDSPSFASDGQRTVSSRWQGWFAGTESRHEVKLLGRKELYVPYNSYAMAQEGVTLDDVFGPKHINQDLVRYELHRVWVIESTLRPGSRHLYHRHTSYVDEDTWIGIAQEAYDARGRMWRMGEQYNLNFYDVQMTRAWGDSLIDLINGRYTTFFGWYGLTGYGQPQFLPIEEADINFDIFTPQGLRRFGRR